MGLTKALLLATPAVIISTMIGYAIADGRYVLDFLNQHCFPRGPAIVTDPRHIEWRNRTRHHVDVIAAELQSWEASGNSFPEFTSLTPPQYFPEAGKDTYGKAQKRAWGFLWLRLYGMETKLAKEFPSLVNLYDGLPVEIISIGISKLDPGRGDVTHFGEFRGTWRQLLTIETPSPTNSVRLGLYPYGKGRLCDSIWTPPEAFQDTCLQETNPPVIHTYEKGKDILFDDSVWHFIDNDSVEGRRVAVWIDVVRTDLNWMQQQVLNAFLFVAKHLNPEVSDVVQIVNALDYSQLSKDRIAQRNDAVLDDAPKGPIESYDKTKILDVDLGFH